jgi:hypothetical protein
MTDIIEPEEKKINPFLGILSHLATLYILIVGISLGVIYYQGVYQNNSLYIYVPFTHIWPIVLIVVGLSIFRVKSPASLIVGVFLLIFAITITSFSVSIRKDAIESNTQTISSSMSGMKSINTDMSFNTTDISIKGGESDIDGKYISNYGILANSITTDKDSVRNINLQQLDIKPGFGLYSKKVTLIFPKNIPAIFDINANLSLLSLDLKDILLKSANFTLKGSEASINLDQIEKESTLNITSNASRVTITIPSNIKVLLSTSHRFTTNDFIGLVQKGVDAKLYESSNYKDLDDNEEKTLGVNLNSTFSQIKVIQQ